MNKNSEDIEFGELSDKSFDFKDITWTIFNASTLPDSVNYKKQSPSFYFAGATWKLVIYPYGQTEHETEGYIDLIVMRLNYLFSEQQIFYKFCFITRNGKEFESYSNFYCFTPEMSVSGVSKYLKKSTFKNKKNILAPNGILTVMCQLRTQKASVIDKYCQIGSTASLLESSVQISEQEAGSSTITWEESRKKDSKQEKPKTSSEVIGCDCRLRKSTPLSLSKTFQDLKELFLKQEDCDVVIKVKGQEFRAHKLILTARSPVFASTFRNDMKEKATGTIDIEDCDPSSFSDFLCFLYCGNVEILTTENVFGLFTAADKYDVQDLRLECLEFMKSNLSVDTFCETLTLALQHFEKELIDLTTDFFAKHWEEILVTVKWQSFIVENPIQGNEMMVKALILKKK